MNRLSVWAEQLKRLVLGKARDLDDHRVFHNLSLIAFFAWVGLGADGLSSTCYGPEEAFRALQGHLHLGILVALATAITILIISAGYTQIVEAFPNGGGGYAVASKLLSPWLGMVSGCALVIDYVLTIALSISSGTDAIFSFLPIELHRYKVMAAGIGVVGLCVLNLRGVRESVLPLVPIFLLFVVTHLFVLVYGLFTHLPTLGDAILTTGTDMTRTSTELGIWGALLLLLRAYSMGAGTYTGIEAVSNAMPLLREPKVETARRTMRYMAISLAVLATGIMLAYTLYEIRPCPGKTMNAVLLENMTAGWHRTPAISFVMVALFAEAVLLIVAAQSGFMGGPRVLANMALDRWVPRRFAMLSDRLVTHNGTLLMGSAALAMILLSGGSVHFLVILYSINVFVTFSLSQLGMVRYWWIRRKRESKWFRSLSINGLGFILTTFILISVTCFKFFEGGWITLLVTGGMATVCVLIHRYYRQTAKLLKRLDLLVDQAREEIDRSPTAEKAPPELEPNARTAVLFVNGFNGLGLHTLFGVIRLFRGSFRNFIFVQVGVIDAGNFKGQDELGRLRESVDRSLQLYVRYLRSKGMPSDSYQSIGTDVAEEVTAMAKEIVLKYPNAVFFSGQLSFKEDTMLNRWLHNQAVFLIQRRLHHQGVPFVILPIRV